MPHPVQSKRVTSLRGDTAAPQPWSHPWSWLSEASLPPATELNAWFQCRAGRRHRAGARAAESDHTPHLPQRAQSSSKHDPQQSWQSQPEASTLGHSRDEGTLPQTHPKSCPLSRRTGSSWGSSTVPGSLSSAPTLQAQVASGPKGAPSSWGSTWAGHGMLDSGVGAQTRLRSTECSWEPRRQHGAT